MDSALIVTVTLNDITRHAFAKFTWDGDDCRMVVMGMTDEELDAILEAKAHEGVKLEGYTVDLA